MSRYDAVADHELPADRIAAAAICAAPPPNATISRCPCTAPRPTLGYRGGGWRVPLAAIGGAPG